MTDAEKAKARRFGSMIKSMRERTELSRIDLADRAGLGADTIARLEDGEQLPTDDTKQKLEKVFGFTLYVEKHKQVKVRVGKRKADIDEGIVPLIEELWKAGIETTLSCQQNLEGLVWIQFLDADEARKFLKIIARLEKEKDTFGDRMTSSASTTWLYDLFVDDMNLSMAIDKYTLEHSGNPYMGFQLSIRFPPQDLPAALDRLRAHNRKSARSMRRQ